MTKRTDKPGRTNPLDRDGDGHAGGSLPGNKTAPMAEGDDTPTAAEGADTVAGDNAADSIEAVESPDTVAADEGADSIEAGDGSDAGMHDTEIAEDDAVDAGGDDRGNAVLLEALELMDDGWAVEPGLTFEVVESWSDDQFAEVNAWLAADENSPLDAPPLTPPEFLAPFLVSTASEADAPAEAAPEPDQARLDQMEQETDEANAAARAEPEPTPTFDAEQVEASGDGIDLDKAMGAIDRAFAGEDEEAGDHPGVAARIAELEVLVNAPRLYKSKDGYSSNYAAPFISEVVIRSWIVAGLAEDIPSAGNDGGVKMTREARHMLAELKRKDAA